MSRMMYLNVCVNDLTKTMRFFTALGFTYNSQFTNEHAACMKINDQCFVMLLTPTHFNSFIKKLPTYAHTHTEVLIAISAESKMEVDNMLSIALSNGATEANEPQDLGFMYSRSFNDLDGHIWEIGWMNPEFINK